MSIRTRVHRDGAVTVHIRPNWLMRWLGAWEQDFEVEYGGGGWWVGADDGIPVSYQVNRAIEREVGR